MQLCSLCFKFRLKIILELYRFAVRSLGSKHIELNKVFLLAFHILFFKVYIFNSI